MRNLIAIVLVLAAVGWLVDVAKAHPYVAIAVGVFVGIPMLLAIAGFLAAKLGSTAQPEASAGEEDRPYASAPEPPSFHVEPRRAACLEAMRHGWDVEIDYIDAQGVCTHRRVTAQSYDSERDILRGFCHLRQEERSFRADRMESIELIESTAGS